tara:strand:- start:69 stop:347 length:279 start_codon:yes stop_codon:yes gene_type:complete
LIKLISIGFALLTAISTPSVANTELEDQLVRGHRREVNSLSLIGAMKVDYKLTKRWSIKLQATSARKIFKCIESKQDERKSLVFIAMLSLKF